MLIFCGGNSIAACAVLGAQEHNHELEVEDSRKDDSTAPPEAPMVLEAPIKTIDNSDGPLGLSANFSNSAYTRSVPQYITLKIDFEAKAEETSLRSTRAPLNLALLIDRSGSMKDEDKFEQTMKAVNLVIENLSERDVLSVIAFGSDALVLAPAGRVVNKAFLRHRLSEVTPDGWTNLSAGLLEAAAQIESVPQRSAAPESGKGSVQNKLIVLTDGKANRGVTDSTQLSGMIKALRERGISVSTIGVGTEFDGDLLSEMAEAGGGRYTYVKTAEGIPESMERELDGFLKVVAQNVQMTIRAGEDTEIVRSYGQLLSEPTRELVFSLGDLREDDRGSFLFELAPRGFDSGAKVEVEITLTSDSSFDAKRHTQARSLQAEYTVKPEEVVAGKNHAVSLYADVLGALEDAEEAVLAFDRERAKHANVLFDVLYEKARASAIATRDQDLLNQTFLLKHFMTELLEAQQSGQMHDHKEAASKLQKEVDYRRYLLGHHRD